MSLRSHSVPASSGRETSPFSTGLPRLEPVRSGQAVGPRTRVSLAIALSLALLMVAAAANGQSCSTSTNLTAPPAWNAPLDRTVSLHARDISLRDALDRVSSDARVLLSYAS